MNRIKVILILLCVLATLSCQDRIKYGRMSAPDLVELAEINDDPQAFLNTKCEVWGYVTQVQDVPFVKPDAFKIFDGTDEIWVYTTRGVPPLNARLRIKGLVNGIGKNPFSITLPIPILNIRIKPEFQFVIFLQELEFFD